MADRFATGGGTIGAVLFPVVRNGTTVCDPVIGCNEADTFLRNLCVKAYLQVASAKRLISFTTTVFLWLCILYPHGAWLNPSPYIS